MFQGQDFSHSRGKIINLGRLFSNMNIKRSKYNCIVKLNFYGTLSCLFVAQCQILFEKAFFNLLGKGREEKYLAFL